MTVFRASVGSYALIVKTFETELSGLGFCFCLLSLKENAMNSKLSEATVLVKHQD